MWGTRFALWLNAGYDRMWRGQWFFGVLDNFPSERTMRVLITILENKDYSLLVKAEEDICTKSTAFAGFGAPALICGCP